MKALDLGSKHQFVSKGWRTYGLNVGGNLPAGKASLGHVAGALRWAVLSPQNTVRRRRPDDKASWNGVLWRAAEKPKNVYLGEGRQTIVIFKNLKNLNIFF